MNQFIKAACFAFCLLQLSCNSGSTEKKAEVSVTEKHISIPDTKFYIVPPPGFTLNSTTKFLESEGRSIKTDAGYINTYPPLFLAVKPSESTESQFENIKTLTDSKYPGLWVKENVEVGGNPATLYRYEKIAGVKAWHLVFADANLQSLMATYDEADDETGEAMKAALKTVIVK